MTKKNHNNHKPATMETELHRYNKQLQPQGKINQHYKLSYYNKVLVELEISTNQMNMYVDLTDNISNIRIKLNKPSLI